MITVYLIQACLFILGVIPFLCELSRHFHDSLTTMTARFFIFLITLICGYYAPLLQSLPDILLVFISLILTYISIVTMKDFIVIYHNKKQEEIKQ